MTEKPQQERESVLQYALIFVVVAAIIIIVLALLGPAVGNVFTERIIGNI